MRRLIAPAAIVAALVLAGCTAPATPDADTTPSTTAPVESPSPAAVDAIDMRDLEQGLVDTLRAEVGDELVSYSDEGLIDLGHSICESLEGDFSPASIQTSLTESGISENVAVNLITGSGVLLCSDQASKVIGGW